MNIFDAFFASYIAVWILLAINSVILVATLRTMGLVLARLPRATALVLEDEGIAVGSTLPEAVLRGLHIDPAVERIPLVFLSTSCVLCRRLAPSIAALHGARVAIHVLIKGEDDEVRTLLGLLGTDASRFAVHDDGAFRHAQIEMTPFALVIDREQRVVAKGLVNDLQQLESLIYADERSFRHGHEHGPALA
jgi:hypothetical protein